MDRWTNTNLKPKKMNRLTATEYNVTQQCQELYADPEDVIHKNCQD